MTMPIFEQNNSKTPKIETAWMGKIYSYLGLVPSNSLILVEYVGEPNGSKSDKIGLGTVIVLDAAKFLVSVDPVLQQSNMYITREKRATVLAAKIAGNWEQIWEKQYLLLVVGNSKISVEENWLLAGRSLLAIQHLEVAVTCEKCAVLADNMLISLKDFKARISIDNEYIVQQQTEIMHQGWGKLTEVWQLLEEIQLADVQVTYEVYLSADSALKHWKKLLMHYQDSIITNIKLGNTTMEKNKRNCKVLPNSLELITFADPFVSSEQSIWYGLDYKDLYLAYLAIQIVQPQVRDQLICSVLSLRPGEKILDHNMSVAKVLAEPVRDYNNFSTTFALLESVIQAYKRLLDSIKEQDKKVIINFPNNWWESRLDAKNTFESADLLGRTEKITLERYTPIAEICATYSLILVMQGRMAAAKAIINKLSDLCGFHRIGALIEIAVDLNCVVGARQKEIIYL